MIWHGYAKTKTELKAYSNESQIDGTKEALGLNFHISNSPKAHSAS